MYRPGESGNIKGRKPGSKNKDKELKERIESLLADAFNIKSIKADLEAMKPKERMDILLKLIQFTLPTMKAVDNSIMVADTSLEDLLSLD